MVIPTLDNYVLMETETLQESFPFLSCGNFSGTEVIGIVQNYDVAFVSFYVYNLLPTPEFKKLFLELGDEWWWGSNRQWPVNIFVGERFRVFKPYLRMFPLKGFELKWGPAISLANQITRRPKRRNIQLVKD